MASSLDAETRFTTEAATSEGAVRSCPTAAAAAAAAATRLHSPSARDPFHAALLHEVQTRGVIDVEVGGGGGNRAGTDTWGRGDDGDGGDDFLEVDLAEQLAIGKRQPAGDVNIHAPGAAAAGATHPMAQWWQTYLHLLSVFPLVTKALTAGLIAFLGDSVAQRFEHHQHQQDQQTGKRRRPLPRFVHNGRRSLAVMMDGVFITGPGLHFMYGLLESHIPTAAGGILPAAMHVLLDTTLMDPFFVGTFFFTTALMEGRSLRRDVIPRVKREYWSAVRGSWGVSVFFWPVQWACFRYLPLQLRVASINVCDVVWTGVLSFFSHRGDGEGGGGDCGGHGSCDAAATAAEELLSSSSSTGDAALMRTPISSVRVPHVVAAASPQLAPAY